MPPVRFGPVRSGSDVRRLRGRRCMEFRAKGLRRTCLNIRRFLHQSTEHKDPYPSCTILRCRRVGGLSPSAMASCRRTVALVSRIVDESARRPDYRFITGLASELGAKPTPSSASERRKHPMTEQQQAEII